MKRAFLNIALVLCGAVIAMLAGEGYLAARLFQGPSYEARYFAIAGIGWGISENDFDQSSNSNFKEAQASLTRVLGVYEQGIREESPVDPTMKKALRLQIALTRARLSVLASEAGEAGPAKQYMAAAQADLQALGWIDTSEAHVRKVIERKPPARKS